VEVVAVEAVEVVGQVVEQHVRATGSPFLTQRP